MQPVGGLIGRSRKCPVSLLHDCEVSHNHAMVEPHAHTPSGFCIRDIGSTFGTYLNDKRLSEPKRASEPYKLKPGDTVKVGQTTLRWQPRQHLDAAASVLRIPPPPLSREADGRVAAASTSAGTGGDDELAKVAEGLDRAHRTLCNAAAAVELAVVARRLEQLLRVQAQADGAPSVTGAERDEWRALLRVECESLRRDVTLLIGQQRECLRKLLSAQSSVWCELRLVTAELLALGGAPPLRASAVQWMRDANHHARWGYRVVRSSQLWLEALEGSTYPQALSDAAPAPLQQRWRMLDGDARVQLAALNAALGGDEVDAREAFEARERLSVSEWELLLLARAHPTLALNDGPASAEVRPAFSLDAASLFDVSSAESLALALPWSLKCYTLRPPSAPPALATAGGEHGCLGSEALFDGQPCILQPCRRSAAEIAELYPRLVGLALRQTSGAAGTQHLPALRAVWRERPAAGAPGARAEGETLWLELATASPDSAATARRLSGAPSARGFGRADGGFASQLSANWRRAFVELATSLSVLHRAGLCAAGVTSEDIALDSDGRVLLLSLGLADLGSAERPVTAGTWRWAAIPPEGHDAGGRAPACWSADMWGVGVLLWRAHFGDDLRALQAFLRAPSAERPACVPQPERADGQLASILAQLLHSEPSMRMCACALLSHSLLQPPQLPTSRVSSLPDAAAALLSADEDVAHVSAAISHARASLADVRARARAAADARGRACTLVVRAGGNLCADMLAAVSRLSDLELLGPLDVRLVRAAPGEEAADAAADAVADAAAESSGAVHVSCEEAMRLFWDALTARAPDGSAVHAHLFDAQLTQPLGVGKAQAPGVLAHILPVARGANPPGPLNALGLAKVASGVSNGGQLHPAALVLRADAPEAELGCVGRLLFKCVLDGLPLPLTALPAYWWRAAVGLGSTAGLAELEAVSPLLYLQYHALIASGTTDGWMLDFEQLGMEPADVPQALKLHWVSAKVRLELWTSRAGALDALHAGFASAARAGAPESAGASQPLQGLPAEALMVLAAGGVTPLAQQLRAALAFRDFPDSSPMEQHLCALIDLMPGAPARSAALRSARPCAVPPARCRVGAQRRALPLCALTRASTHCLAALSCAAVQLRRFVLLLTGFVELPTLRQNGTPTVITVRATPVPPRHAEGALVRLLPREPTLPCQRCDLPPPRSRRCATGRMRPTARRSRTALR